MRGTVDNLDILTLNSGSVAALTASENPGFVILVSGQAVNKGCGQNLVPGSFFLTDSSARLDRSFEAILKGTTAITGLLSFSSWAAKPLETIQMPLFEVLSPRLTNYLYETLVQVSSWDSLQERLFQLTIESLVLEKIRDAQKSKPQMHALVVEVCKYLRDNLERNVRLDELAQTHHVSREFLTRLFQRDLGLSPMRYYRELRVKKAEELLQQGYSVKETSWTLGFSSPFHFSRLFKSIRGYSPRDS